MSDSLSANMHLKISLAFSFFQIPAARQADYICIHLTVSHFHWHLRTYMNQSLLSAFKILNTLSDLHLTAKDKNIGKKSYVFLSNLFWASEMRVYVKMTAVLKLLVQSFGWTLWTTTESLHFSHIFVIVWFKSSGVAQKQNNSRTITIQKPTDLMLQQDNNK